jgi:hypothetical protein
MSSHLAAVPDRILLPALIGLFLLGAFVLLVG